MTEEGKESIALTDKFKIYINDSEKHLFFIDWCKGYKKFLLLQ